MNSEIDEIVPYLAGLFCAAFLVGWGGWSFLFAIVLFYLARKMLKQLKSRIEIRDNALLAKKIQFDLFDRAIESESLVWLNALIEQIWRLNHGGLSQWLQATLQPLLDWCFEGGTNVIKSMVIQELALGPTPPTLSHFRIFGRERMPDGCLILDTDVTLGSDLVLTFTLKLGRVTIPCRASRLTFKGKLRLSLSFVSGYPGVHTLSLSFLEKPAYDLSIKPLNSVDLMDLPGAYQYLQGLLDWLLQDFIVSPNKWDLPFYDWFGAPSASATASTSASSEAPTAVASAPPASAPALHPLPLPPGWAPDRLFVRLNYCDISSPDPSFGAKVIAVAMSTGSSVYVHTHRHVDLPPTQQQQQDGPSPPSSLFEVFELPLFDKRSQQLTVHVYTITATDQVQRALTAPVPVPTVPIPQPTVVVKRSFTAALFGSSATPLADLPPPFISGSSSQLPMTQLDFTVLENSSAEGGSNPPPQPSDAPAPTAPPPPPPPPPPSSLTVRVHVGLLSSECPNFNAQSAFGASTVVRKGARADLSAVRAAICRPPPPPPPPEATRAASAQQQPRSIFSELSDSVKGTFKRVGELFESNEQTQATQTQQQSPSPPVDFETTKLKRSATSVQKQRASDDEGSNAASAASSSGHFAVAAARSGLRFRGAVGASAAGRKRTTSMIGVHRTSASGMHAHGTTRLRTSTSSSPLPTAATSPSHEHITSLYDPASATVSDMKRVGGDGEERQQPAAADVKPEVKEKLQQKLTQLLDGFDNEGGERAEVEVVEGEGGVGVSSKPVAVVRKQTVTTPNAQVIFSDSEHEDDWVDIAPSSNSKKATAFAPSTPTNNHQHSDSNYESSASQQQQRDAMTNMSNSFESNASWPTAPVATSPTSIAVMSEAAASPSKSVASHRRGAKSSATATKTAEEGLEEVAPDFDPLNALSSSGDEDGHHMFGITTSNSGRRGLRTDLSKAMGNNKMLDKEGFVVLSSHSEDVYRSSQQPLKRSSTESSIGGSGGNSSSNKAAVDKGFLASRKVVAKLRIDLMAGAELVPMDPIELSNPMCVFQVGSGQKAKSRVLARTTSPAWDERIDLSVRAADITDKSSMQLLIRVMDGHRLGSDRLMGHVTLDVDSFHKATGGRPAWVPLEQKDAGRILIALSVTRPEPKN